MPGKSFLLNQIKKIPPQVWPALLALVLCLNGIGWGRVEEWNPDQMAHLNLFSDPQKPFKPVNYLKPPFHTYTNYFLSVAPVGLVGRAVGLTAPQKRAAALSISRLITALMFSLSVVVLYQILRLWENKTVALTTSFLFATSAGLVAYAHFLTADIPVMFWMLLGTMFGFFLGRQAN